MPVGLSGLRHGTVLREELGVETELATESTDELTTSSEVRSAIDSLGSGDLDTSRGTIGEVVNSETLIGVSDTWAETTPISTNTEHAATISTPASTSKPAASTTVDTPSSATSSPAQTVSVATTNGDARSANAGCGCSVPGRSEPSRGGSLLLFAWALAALGGRRRHLAAQSSVEISD